MRAELAAIVLLMLAFAAPAAAQMSPQDEAGLLYDQAVEFFAAEEWEEASSLLLRAYELDPNPRLAYNVGRALDRAGRTDEALTYYLLAHQATGDDDLVGRAAASVAALHANGVARGVAARAAASAPELGTARQAQVAAAAAERARRGTIVVRAEGVSDAYVQVADGAPQRVPAELDVEPGEHSLSVWSEDGGSWRRDVSVDAGETARVDVTWGEAAPRGHGLRTAGLATAGVGVAMVGLGVAMYGSASSSYDDAAGLARDGTDRAAFDDAVSSGEGSATVSTIAYGVGAAALATGVTLVVLDATRGGERATVSGRVSVRPGGLSVQVGW